MTLTIIFILIGILNLGISIYIGIQINKYHKEQLKILKYIAAAANIRMMRGNR